MKNEYDILTISAHPDLKALLTPIGAGLYQLYYKGKPLLTTGEGDGYFKPNPAFFGQTVSPFAGRILHGKIGPYLFPTNEGPNCLHSGPFTTAFQEFAPQIDECDSTVDVSFFHVQTYQGVKIVTKTTYVFYRRAPRFSIRIDLTTSAPFPHNQTHHAYWNLGVDNLCDLRIHMASHQRVNYGPSKHPLGYMDCRDEFASGTLKIDDTLDYGYLLDEPTLTVEGKGVRLKAKTSAKAVLVYAGLPGPRPCVTLEFVDAPLNGDDMMKEGTTTVLAEYELEEI